MLPTTQRPTTTPYAGLREQESVIDQRLRAMAGAVHGQLADLFRRGEIPASIFVPPAGVDAVVEIDTSDQDSPGVDEVEAAVVALLA